MFVVVWDDWEGNQRERAFDDLEDAAAEAADLREKFDFVKIEGRSEK